MALKLYILPAFPANIRLDRRGQSATNTLAYYFTELIMAL
jgi:hypothetical protein